MSDCKDCGDCGRADCTEGAGPGVIIGVLIGIFVGWLIWAPSVRTFCHPWRGDYCESRYCP